MATKHRPPKNCTLCRYFTFDLGWSGTDVTPGDPTVIGCDKDHWQAEAMDDPSSFRRRLQTAKNCKDFRWYDRKRS